MGPAPKIAPRPPLEAHFDHFWALLPKSLPGGLWRLILSISEPCFQNCSQNALLPKWHPGSNLYRTCVAEVTFYRPCAPEECAWGALWPSQNSFARTCVVNTILACTLGLDSQLGAPCSGSGSSLHRTCVAEVTFYRPCPPEECAWVPFCPPGRVSHAPV